MKFVYPGIDYIFDTQSEKVNTLIIENQSLFYKLIVDLNNQLFGLDGLSVVSLNDKELVISKNVELLDRFVPFNLNPKTLITKISAELENKAVSDDYYEKTAELMGEIERYLLDLSFDFFCDIQFAKVNIGAIIKASGVEVNDNYDSLSERIIDYFGEETLYVLFSRAAYISKSIMLSKLSKAFAKSSIKSFVLL